MHALMDIWTRDPASRHAFTIVLISISIPS